MSTGSPAWVRADPRQLESKDPEDDKSHEMSSHPFDDKALQTEFAVSHDFIDGS